MNRFSHHEKDFIAIANRDTGEIYEFFFDDTEADFQTVIEMAQRFEKDSELSFNKKDLEAVVKAVEEARQRVSH